MNEENYGTEVSIEELKGHYKTNFLTAEQFIDLVKEWHGNEVKRLTEQLRIGIVSEHRELLKAFLEHYESVIDFLPTEPSVLIDGYLNSL
jgi:hypothetical protein